MSPLQEIQKESNGALFRRADLHIHSFGAEGSYDVTDATMTPEAIVDTSIAERLDLIAITDHNQIGNVRSALKYAQGKSLLVVPGVELSTPQGHLLVYFETADQLQRFFGKLTISDGHRVHPQGHKGRRRPAGATDRAEKEPAEAAGSLQGAQAPDPGALRPPSQDIQCSSGLRDDDERKSGRGGSRLPGQIPVLRKLALSRDGRVD
ncbi:PHP domain-containing protein [Burkholderia dolosa]|nr:PHP domain-containing protein [Burkholderia dolosa]